MSEMLCPNCGKEYRTGDEACRYCGYVFPFSTVVIASGRTLQGRYEIQELIHTGGMGYIYLAKDKRLYDRICIVKQVRESITSEAHRKKLEAEAQSMTKLNHPNIAMIFDHFVEEGYYYLVVERISGQTLSEVFKDRGGQLGEEEVWRWAVDICDVVGYLHRAGVIHRDISPDNIMLNDEGIIKFIDFGTSHEFRYTAPGGTVGIGKYGYTPPEQWRGKPEQRSDIFALGATIYYLLSGYLPLSQGYITGQAPQKADFNPSFPPITAKNPAVSPRLEAVLQKALQLDINKRYASAAEFGQALKALLPEGTRRAGKKAVARPVSLGVGIALAVAGLGAAWLLTLLWVVGVGGMDPPLKVTQLALILAAGLVGVVPGVLLLRRGITGHFRNRPEGGRVTGWWWLPSLALGFIGGVFTWFRHKDINWRQSRNMLTAGILMTFVFIAPVLAAGHERDVLPPGSPPVTQNGTPSTPGPGETTVPATTPPATTATQPVLDFEKIMALTQNPSAFFELDYNQVDFGTGEIYSGQVFPMNFTGKASCIQDMGLDNLEVRVKYQITARNNASSARVTLNPDLTVNIEDFPTRAGESYAIDEVVLLQFPETAATGEYTVIGEIVEVMVKIGSWFDISPYLEEAGDLGTLQYVAANPATQSHTFSGHVLEADTRNPIAGAVIHVIEYDSRVGYYVQRGDGRTDAAGYYATSPFSQPGPFALYVNASGYATEWYDDEYIRNDATPLEFLVSGEISNINFLLEPEGTISGRVIADNTLEGIAGLNVMAVDGFTGIWMAGVNTSSDGTYTLTGLPAWSYRVQASASNSMMPYANEYYPNTFDWGRAEQITVADEQDVRGIDFTLAPGGSISGTIRAAYDLRALSGVSVQPFQIVDGRWLCWGAISDENGNYTVYGVPYGQLYVRAPGRFSDGDGDFVQEYYLEQWQQAQAMRVTVGEDNNPSNINFTLAAGGSISGRVISDASFEGIANLHVFAADYDTGEWLSGAFTDADGNYALRGLPAGTCWVRAVASNNGLPYTDEFYFNADNPNDALPITVRANQDTSGINFSLSPTA